MKLTELLFKYYPLKRSQNRLSFQDILSIKEFSKSLEKERERANRNNHQLSLIVFEFESFEFDNLIVNQFLKKAKNRIRKIDEIGFYRSNKIGILMPYTNYQGAVKYIENLTQQLPVAEPFKDISIYSYPVD